MNKINIAAYLFILSLLCCLMACQTEPKKKTSNTPATAQKANQSTDVKPPKYAGDTGIDDGDLQTLGPLKYSIRNVNHSSDKDIYTITMSYPIFEGYKDEEAQNRLNKLIYHYIDQEVRSFKIYAIQNNSKGRNDLLITCEAKKFGRNEKKIRLNFMTDVLHSDKDKERNRKPYNVAFNLESAMPQVIQEMEIPITAQPTIQSKSNAKK